MIGPAARPRRGLDRALTPARATRPEVDWAPERGGTLVRIEAAASAPSAEQVRAFLGAQSAGPWAEAVCPTGEDDG